MLGEQPDRLKDFSDVFAGDADDAGQAVAQHDPGRRPVHRLVRRRLAVAKRDGLLHQRRGAQVEAQQRGLVVDAQLADGEHPRVVERRVAAQPQICQVRPGLV